MTSVTLSRTRLRTAKLNLTAGCYWPIAVSQWQRSVRGRFPVWPGILECVLFCLARRVCLPRGRRPFLQPSKSSGCKEHWTA